MITLYAVLVFSKEYPLEKMKLHFLPTPLHSPFPQLPAATASLQPCPTLCDPADGSPPGSAAGSTAPGILQARTLEWAAMASTSA